MQKRLLAWVALMVVAAAPAFAADAPPSRRAPAHAPVYVPFFTWSGFYVGFNAGYGWGTSNWTSALGTTGDFRVSGGVFGGTLGYNMQMGSAVFGLEGDFDWSGIKGSSTSVVCLGSCETKNTWLATARGRIGYAFDRFLPYATGGAAFGNLKMTGPLGGASSTKTGWALGAGLEYAFTTSWSAKLEYLYVDLGKATCNAACTGVPADVTFQTSLVRAGVNYKF
jgi:outer membrane immunogenic protein